MVGHMTFKLCGLVGTYSIQRRCVLSDAGDSKLQSVVASQWLRRSTWRSTSSAERELRAWIVDAIRRLRLEPLSERNRDVSPMMLVVRFDGYVESASNSFPDQHLDGLCMLSC